MIEGVIALLADNPLTTQAAKLVGTRDRWRVRAGDHRANSIGIDDGILTVLVIRVAHRREVYRDLWSAAGLRGARDQFPEPVEQDPAVLSGFCCARGDLGGDLL